MASRGTSYGARAGELSWDTSWILLVIARKPWRIGKGPRRIGMTYKDSLRSTMVTHYFRMDGEAPALSIGGLSRTYLLPLAWVWQQRSLL